MAENKYLNLSGLQYFLRKLDDKKADIESPELTGTPTAPTADAGTNNTQLATTAFVQNTIDNYFATSYSYKQFKIELLDNYRNGVLSNTADTSLAELYLLDTNSQKILDNTIYSSSELYSETRYPLSNLTDGNFTTFTCFKGTSELKYYVEIDLDKETEISGILIAPRINSTQYANIDKIIIYGRNNSEDNWKLLMSTYNLKDTWADSQYKTISFNNFTQSDFIKNPSPALTGTPTAPTAANGTNNNQIATTAFVQSAVAAAAGLVLTAPNGTQYQLSVNNDGKLITTLIEEVI